MANMTKNAKTTPMMQQYLDAKALHPDFVLFFRLGDFYEMFFDDAIAVSKALDLTLTRRGQHDGQDIPMCGIPFHAYDNYIARLIRKGFKVAVCEQAETLQTKETKGIMQRRISRLVTAGTLTEESMLTPKASNYIAVIARLKGQTAIAVADISSGVFLTELCQNTASSLAKFAPSEIIVSDDFPETEGATKLPAARFNHDGARKAVCAYYGIAGVEGLGPLEPAQVLAAGVLIDYVTLTHQGQPPALGLPQAILPDQIMEIDAATRRNLELFSGQSSCLIDVIDNTVTAAGGREIRAYLTGPLTDINAINSRLDMVQLFKHNRQARQDMQELLRQTYDIKRSLARLSSGKGGPRDLAAIRDTLLALPQIQVGLLGWRAMAKPEVLEKLTAQTKPQDELARLLQLALSDSLPLLTRDGGFIAKGYSPQLDELLEIRDDSKRLIANLQAMYSQQTGVGNLKVNYNNLIGFFIEVPAKSAHVLMNDKERFIHRQTMLNVVRFTTGQLAELEDKITNARTRSIGLELEIFARLSEQVLEKSHALNGLAAALAMLDALLGLAQLADDNNYCRPVLDHSTDFEITGGAHPVVAKALGNRFIDNDCALMGGQKIWLLTGPNMAGKSTFLRQNALLAIMAQIGSFVPAKAARIGLIDRMFSRVGAGDDLAKGQSTFMVEMMETATILNRATDRSFVILDEIGRGTATFDGLAIAWAVVEYLHTRTLCRTLFATHYHELTALTAKLKDLALYNVTVKQHGSEIVFLHRVEKGAADKSYGIHVASLAGLPKSVIARASAVLDSLEKNENKAANLLSLPLFAASAAARPQPDEPTPLQRRLASIDPDRVSPKDALELLYELKLLDKGASS
ncbi:MAG: DNA mismatch repair protein MutS [Alphaproteobacteria bacterium]|nr:DNA mismatch repair protein MutS [Alphaproteobacteria bacterium]